MEKPVTNITKSDFVNNTTEGADESEINHIAFDNELQKKIYFCDDAGSIGVVTSDKLSPVAL